MESSRTLGCQQLIFEGASQTQPKLGLPSLDQQIKYDNTNYLLARTGNQASPTDGMEASKRNAALQSRNFVISGEQCTNSQIYTGKETSTNKHWQNAKQRKIKNIKATEKKIPKDALAKIRLKYAKYHTQEINAVLRREIKPIG